MPFMATALIVNHFCVLVICCLSGEITRCVQEPCHEVQHYQLSVFPPLLFWECPSSRNDVTKLVREPATWWILHWDHCRLQWISVRTQIKCHVYYTRPDVCKSVLHFEMITVIYIQEYGILMGKPYQKDTQKKIGCINIKTLVNSQIA